MELIENLLQLTLGSPEESHPAVAVSPATAVVPGGSSASSDLAQEYERRKQKLRPGDINALTALKREFRKKGLDLF